LLFLEKRGASHEAGSNDWQTPLEPWPLPETSILLRSDAEERIGDTPFLGKKNPSFDEISAFVDAQVQERLEDEVWVNVRRHLISFRKLLYSGRKEVEPTSLRAVRVSTRKDHFYAKESRCRSR
jgi:hypothetical protein